MRRRLLVAKALIHRPPVVVLDEPTAGVDVELRRSLWSYMRRLNREGVTVVLTTHYLEEAEAMCDRIAIIDQGRLVACDDTARLIGRLDEKTADGDARRAARGAAGGARRARRARSSRSAGWCCATGRAGARVGEILDAVRAAGLTIADLATAEADLEELVPAASPASARRRPASAGRSRLTREAFDKRPRRWHDRSQVQQRKGGDPMSHAKVARLAGTAYEALVTSARIG